MRFSCFFALAALTILGCEPSLPGPLECEKMAYAVLGRSPRAAVHSPKVRRVAERLVHGCLTVPFDSAAVACAQSGQSFVNCAEGLIRRAPERRENLSRLIHDLNQLVGRSESTHMFR